MKQIKMNRDEIIQWGPMRLLKDGLYLVPEEVAASLVGRGIAAYEESNIVKVDVELDLPEPKLTDLVELPSLTKAELVELAKEVGLAGYSTMNKAELVEALSA